MAESTQKRPYRRKHFYKVTCVRSEKLLSDCPWLKYQERDFCMMGYSQPTPEEAVKFIGNPVYDRFYDKATSVQEISKEEALRGFNMDNWRNQKVFGADVMSEQKRSLSDAISQEQNWFNDSDMYPVDFGNGYKIRTVYANKTKDGIYGGIYDFRADVIREHPGDKVMMGYCVINEATGLVANGCNDWNDTISAAILDYEEHVVAALDREEDIELNCTELDGKGDPVRETLFSVKSGWLQDYLGVDNQAQLEALMTNSDEWDPADILKDARKEADLSGYCEGEVTEYARERKDVQVPRRITLSDLIVELMKLQKEHGNDEVLSIGTTHGMIKGMDNPFCIHFAGDVSEYIPAFQKEDTPEIEALRGEISNLRHELNGVMGYEGEDELVPFIEKMLFRRVCELYAAENGIKLEKSHLEKIEQIYDNSTGNKDVLNIDEVVQSLVHSNETSGLVQPAPFEHDPLREYGYTVEYEINGKPNMFEVSIPSRSYPTTDTVIYAINEHLSAEYDLETAKAAFASIECIHMTVTQEGEYVDSDELAREELAQFLAKYADRFDIRAVYSAIWRELENAGDEQHMDVASPGYKKARSLLADLCSRISPEIYDMAFDNDGEDLVFNSSRLGYAIFYYNPDSVEGGQIVECPFNGEQAGRMLNEIESDGNMQDVLCENTQYLSDVNTVHFFGTVESLLYAKLDGDYRGIVTEAVLQSIMQEQEVEKAALTDQIQSATVRAGSNCPETMEKVPEPEL